MDHGPVSHATAGSQHRLAVDNAVVLDVGALLDADGVLVGADGGVGAYPAVFADGHLTYHHRGGVHVGRLGYLGSLAVQFVNGHEMRCSGVLGSGHCIIPPTHRGCIMATLRRPGQDATMKWASAISELPDLRDAVQHAARRVKANLDGQRPDLVLAFVSSAHRADYDRVPDLIGEILPVENLLGCSGGGVIGQGVEVEDRAAVSVTGAVSPRRKAQLLPRRGPGPAHPRRPARRMGGDAGGEGP